MNNKINVCFEYLLFRNVYLICMHLLYVLGTHVCWHALGSQRTTCWSQFSPCQSPPGISGPQAWHQSPLPAEPCCLPKINSVSVAKYISVNLYLFHMYENIPMGLLDIYI